MIAFIPRRCGLCARGLPAFRENPWRVIHRRLNKSAAAREPRPAFVAEKRHWISAFFTDSVIRLIKIGNKAAKAAGFYRRSRGARMAKMTDRVKWTAVLCRLRWVNYVFDRHFLIGVHARMTKPHDEIMSSCVRRAIRRYVLRCNSTMRVGRR